MHVLHFSLTKHASWTSSYTPSLSLWDKQNLRPSFQRIELASVIEGLTLVRMELGLTLSVSQRLRYQNSSSSWDNGKHQENVDWNTILFSLTGKNQNVEN